MNHAISGRITEGGPIKGTAAVLFDLLENGCSRGCSALGSAILTRDREMISRPVRKQRD